MTNGFKPVHLTVYACLKTTAKEGQLVSLNVGSSEFSLETLIITFGYVWFDKEYSDLATLYYNIKILINLASLSQRQLPCM